MRSVPWSRVVGICWDDDHYWTIGAYWGHEFDLKISATICTGCFLIGGGLPWIQVDAMSRCELPKTLRIFVQAFAQAEQCMMVSMSRASQ